MTITFAPPILAQRENVKQLLLFVMTTMLVPLNIAAHSLDVFTIPETVMTVMPALMTVVTVPLDVFTPPSTMMTTMHVLTISAT
jgi:hypothetical protein